MPHLSRRTLLANGAAAALAAPATARFSTPRDPLIGLSATAAVAAMRAGELRAEDYARALLAQAARLQALNAFRTLVPAAVLAAAVAADRRRAAGEPLGRLHGLPTPIKDSVDTASLPTSNGTFALKDFRPSRDAAVVGRLVSEGALVMGKTNLHELSFGWTSANATFGPVHNAYDPARSPGGSSGGSATAVAARMAPLAIAEDTWASIRLPAAFSGLAGLRPTYGRYPDDGIMPLTTMFDQVGPLARSVEDLLLFDGVVAADQSPVAPTPGRKARIGVSEHVLWEGLDPDVERVARAALARLRDGGVRVADIAAIEAVATAPEIATTIIAHQARDSISAFLAREGTGVSFDTLIRTAGANVRSLMTQLALPPSRPSRQAFEAALAKRAALKQTVERAFAKEDIDALVFPVAMVAPPPIGVEDEVMIAGYKVSLATALARNTALGSCLGMASLVLPAGLDRNGLPVGLEFAALPGRDRALLRLGLDLERALGPIAPPAIAG